MFGNYERRMPRLMQNTRVAMRDGVELSSDVYLPPTGDGPWPVILVRTPYDNAREAGVKRAVWFAKNSPRRTTRS